MTNDKLVWLELDLSDFSKEIRAAFDEGSKHAKLASEFYRKGEAGVLEAARKVKAIEADETIVFSYRFGKRSIAVVKAETVSKPKAAAKTFKLGK
jgi:hypothetical protein